MFVQSYARSLLLLLLLLLVLPEHPADRTILFAFIHHCSPRCLAVHPPARDRPKFSRLRSAHQVKPGTSHTVSAGGTNYLSGRVTPRKELPVVAAVAVDAEIGSMAETVQPSTRPNERTPLVPQ